MTDSAAPDPTPYRVAVIGSGPAGFYAAGHLLADAVRALRGRHARAPAHALGPRPLRRRPRPPQDQVRHPHLRETAAHPRFRFFGNVTFGEHVSREELLAHYHAIVYATGSPSDRPLGIPGEDLPGSHAATEFVGWYNGHPDHTDLELDLLSAERAVVIGNGNVALDVARMLVLAPSELAPTDTADHALDVLARSRVTEVVVVGRRGPAQAAFTNPELRELGELADADVIVDPDELEPRSPSPTPTPRPTPPPAQRRDPARLRRHAHPPGRPKRIVLRFLLSPTALIAGAHRPSLRRRVRPQPPRPRHRRRPARAAPQTSARRSPPDSSSARSATAASPSPMSPSTSAPAPSPTTPAASSTPPPAHRLPGEYVVGWIKRGPSGVIGTNKKDAQETVDAIFADLPSAPPTARRRPRPRRPYPRHARPRRHRGAPARAPARPRHLRRLGIDRPPRARPRRARRAPRVKLTRIEEMLRVAASERPPLRRPTPRSSPRPPRTAHRSLRPRAPVMWQTVAAEPR